MSRPIQIVPSVLPADFSKFGDEVAALEAAGVDHIQWDVMDGQFVPNLTFGPDVIASARSHTSLAFEAHLMVYTPDVMAKQYIDAGCYGSSCTPRPAPTCTAPSATSTNSAPAPPSP